MMYSDCFLTTVFMMKGLSSSVDSAWISLLTMDSMTDSFIVPESEYVIKNMVSIVSSIVSDISSNWSSVRPAVHISLSSMSQVPSMHVCNGPLLIETAAIRSVPLTGVVYICRLTFWARAGVIVRQRISAIKRGVVGFIRLISNFMNCLE